MATSGKRSKTNIFGATEKKMTDVATSSASDRARVTGDSINSSSQQNKSTKCLCFPRADKMFCLPTLRHINYVNTASLGNRVNAN